MLIKFKCGNWQVEANSWVLGRQLLYFISTAFRYDMTLPHKKMQERLAHPGSTSNVDQHIRYKLNNLSHPQMLQ